MLSKYRKNIKAKFNINLITIINSRKIKRNLRSFESGINVIKIFLKIIRIK